MTAFLLGSVEASLASAHTPKLILTPSPVQVDKIEPPVLYRDEVGHTLLGQHDQEVPRDDAISDPQRDPVGRLASGHSLKPMPNQPGREAGGNVAPTVTITGVPPKINSSTFSFKVTFTFSENVTGFRADDLTVSGGIVGIFGITTVNQSTYQVDIFTQNSNLTLTVRANSAIGSDGITTGPAQAVSATAIWDATAPTVMITGVPSRISSTADFTATFTFSEAVTDFRKADVTVTGGTAGSLTGSDGDTEYTLEITPTGDTNVTVEVAANSVSDGVNTGPSTAVSATATWDAAPTVEITGVPARINSTTAFPVTFTFSESVMDFVTGDVTVTGGTKSSFSGSGRSYSLQVTPAGGSDVTVTVAANAATDGFSTGPASAVSATAIWDAAAPTVEITGVPARINSTTAFPVTFTFSESVTGFVTGDVTVTGGTKSSFSGNGATYSLDVTPDGGSDVTVTVAANAATDGLNTGPASAVSATATWDAAAPTVDITGVPARINSTTAFPVTFTFSESVTGFVTGDVTVTGGTKSSFSGNGATYSLDVTPDGGSDVTVTVAANAATDGLNTGPASAVSATAIWDAAAPTVEITGVPTRINSTTAFPVAFTFSESVTDFVTGDVTVTGGTKSSFSGNGATYSLDVTPAGGSDVTVTVAENAATDGINTGPASAVSATATWDAAVPTVEITGVPLRINSTTAFPITFTFSESVTDFVTGDVTVTGGTKSSFSGNGATYSLDVTPAGGSDVTVTVAANAATDGLNTGPASAVLATAIWDAAALTVDITGVPARINSTTAFPATFTFSESVTGFVTGDVTVTGGTKSSLSGNGATYTMEVTPDGGSDVTVTVAEDAATDGLNSGPASAVSVTATWDAIPTVNITGVPSRINSTTAFTVTFTFSESVTGFETGDVTVTGSTKSSLSGNGAIYTLNVTPAGGSDVTVTVAANAATDGLNTGPVSAVSATAIWDAAALTVDITGVPARINSTTAFPVTFTFSESVTGFLAGDVRVTGGTNGNLSGSGSSYSLEVTPAGGSDVTVEVAANAATGGSNTGPESAVSATAIWDATAPTVSIDLPQKINSTADFTVIFTFSENVTDFEAADITVTGGTKGNLSGNGDTYTLEVTPAGGSGVTVEVAPDAATDGLNTGPISAVSATATWEVASTAVLIGDATATEGSPLTFTVELDQAVSGGLTVTPTFTDGTATEGDDYTENTAALTFTGTAGETQTFTVATTDDALVEGDEVFTVGLTVSGTTTTVTATDTGTGTITDNDAMPEVTFALTSGSVDEDVGTHNVTININPAAAAALTVTYDLGGTATRDTDYTGSGSVSVAVGATSADIPVAIIDDSEDEYHETITLTLTTDGTAYTVGSAGVHTLTITDNDATPEAAFDVESGTAGEDAGMHEIQIKVSPAPAAAITLNYSLEGGTATETADYRIENAGEISVAAGVDAVKIPVIIVDDLLDESEETVILTLTGGTGYMVGSRKAYTLTITDNETAVTLSASPNPVSEAEAVTVMATLSEAASTEVTIPLVLTAGTAEEGDYGAIASIAIDKDELSGTGMMMTFADDDLDDETFTVTLGTLPSSIVAGAQASIEITITDAGERTSIESLEDAIPTDFSLEQNYPNPFNPSTAIEFSITKTQHVTLTVYDLLGQKVRTLLDGVQPAGRHNVLFSGMGLASDTYLYILQTEEHRAVKMMTLLK